MDHRVSTANYIPFSWSAISSRPSIFLFAPAWHRSDLWGERSRVPRPSLTLSQGRIKVRIAHSVLL